jgi:integrase
MNCVILKEYRAKRNKEREFLGLPPMTEDDLIFAHINGQPYNPHLIDHVWRKLTKRCGISGMSLHAGVRHSHATIMLKNGVHPKIVQERLGHSSIEMTLDTYSHVVQGMGEAAAAGFDEAIFGGNQEKNIMVEPEK